MQLKRVLLNLNVTHVITTLIMEVKIVLLQKVKLTKVLLKLSVTHVITTLIMEVKIVLHQNKNEIKYTFFESGIKNEKQNEDKRPTIK